MAFRDFTYPNVLAELGLALQEARLFESVEPLLLSSEFLARLTFTTDLGLAIDTEKARSELIVMPLLVELKVLHTGSFGLFSGVSLDVDTSRGLTGFCDFLLTRSPLQTVVSAPVLTIVEAKNDNLRTDLGQCIAATVAAREFNALEKSPPTAVYGAVTTGAEWRFLRLDGSVVTIDLREYQITEPGRILAILSRIIE